MSFRKEVVVVNDEKEVDYLYYLINPPLELSRFETLQPAIKIELGFPLSKYGYGYDLTLTARRAYGTIFNSPDKTPTVECKILIDNIRIDGHDLDLYKKLYPAAFACCFYDALLDHMARYSLRASNTVAHLTAVSTFETPSSVLKKKIYADRVHIKDKYLRELTWQAALVTKVYAEMGFVPVRFDIERNYTEMAAPMQLLLNRLKDACNQKGYKGYVSRSIAPTSTTTTTDIPEFLQRSDRAARKARAAYEVQTKKNRMRRTHLALSNHPMVSKRLVEKSRRLLPSMHLYVRKPNRL